MKIKFDSEEVEIDGILYDVFGSYDPDTEDVWDLRVFVRRSDQQIQDHLMDSVVEDIMTELHQRYSLKASSDEFFDDAEGDFEEDELDDPE